MLVEIYNTSDVKQGTIDTITSWNNTAKLDRAGTFSFTMPVADNKYSDLVTHKRIAKCYRIVGGSRTLVGAGVIDETSIALKTGKNGTEVDTLPGMTWNGIDDLEYVRLAFLEIGLNLANALNVEPRVACTKNHTDCQEVLKLNCTDSKEPMIQLSSKENTLISLNNNCIYVQGKKEELLKASDRLLFQWFGIM